MEPTGRTDKKTPTTAPKTIVATGPSGKKITLTFRAEKKGTPAPKKAEQVQQHKADQPTAAETSRRVQRKRKVINVETEASQVARFTLRLQHTND